jgi:transporter family protein
MLEQHAWLLFSAGAAVAWGLWAFLPKLALARARPEAVFVVEALGAVIAGLCILPFCPRAFHPLGALCAFGAGIVGYVGVFIFIRLADKKQIGPLASTTALYPLVTVFLSALFLDERLTPRQYAGVALALAAVFLINIPARENAKDRL